VRLEPIVDAVRRIGLDERSLEAAEDAGLVHIDRDGVRFRHPLVRSAVVQTAAASERRRAHRALADALADGSPDERAWHLSAAALGFDEQAATELAQAAVRTRARSGWAPAALALERSARLTRDPDVRADRLLDAAESAMVGGRIELTLSLTDELLAHQDGAPRRARVIRLRGQIELHCGDVGHALDHLLEGADVLARDDPAAATAMLADAVEAAELLGKPRRALQAAAGADALRTGHEPDELVAEFALGQALRLAGRPADARPHLERALAVLTSGGEPRASMRAFTRGAHAAGWLDRVPEGLVLARCAVDAAREQGAFGPLAHALEVTTALDATAGRWREGHGHASEALELARAARCAWTLTRCLEHLAWLEAAQGNEERCRAHAADADAVAADAGFHSGRARAAVGLLELGLGRVDDAARVFDAIDPAALERIGAGDFVEALIRGGRTEEARAALERLPAGQEAVAARCAGLLGNDEDFEAPFAQALDRHAEHDAFGRARTPLCLGERRRRAGRRVEARTELRAAHEVFGRLGARPWADRAASELRATGERLGRREARPGDELTPQELQVALQAAEGRTNKEIGAALFLSPKTVDFHLRRVFRKLDVRSRGELIRHFAVTAR
jgi:DNA-binding CsgD family transcriptional regulator